MYVPIVKTFNYDFLEMPAIKTMFTLFLSTSLPIDRHTLVYVKSLKPSRAHWHTLVYVKSLQPSWAHWHTLGPLLQSQHLEDRKRTIRSSRLASTIH